jgi:SAM-dependent methyltransferase
MSIDSPWAGLASTVQRRLSAGWRRHTGAATPAPVAEPAPPAAPQPAPEPDPFAEEVRAYLYRKIVERYGEGEQANRYMANDLNHVRRYVTSLTWVPEGEGRVIDPAAGNGLFPALLRHFRRCEVEVPAYFNLEKDRAPYPDEAFDGVVLMEVLEHFTVDPMGAVAELNRMLKPGGFLFLTTPNIASWVSLYNLIHYHSPYMYGVFERHHCPDRHNREYTVLEVGRLAEAVGFRVERLEAITVYPDHDAVGPIPGIRSENRGDTTFLLARKEGPVRERYPEWLYTNWGN